MGKFIKFCSDKAVDIIIALFTGGGAMTFGLSDNFPLTFVYMFALVAILIGLMIWNQLKSRTHNTKSLKTNNTQFVVSYLSKPLTQDDLELLLCGTFKENKFIPYLFPREYIKTSMETEKKMTFSYHLSPYNSKAKLRLTAISVRNKKSLNLDISKLIFYVDDPSQEQKTVYGSGGEFEVFIPKNNGKEINTPNFDIKIEYNDKSLKLEKMTVEFKIDLISWKKI